MKGMLPMKKKLLFFSLVAFALPLASCNKATKEIIEYKFDTPQTALEGNTGCYMVYPEETVSTGHYFDIWGSVSTISDKYNVIITNLDKVETFVKLDSISPTTDKCVRFFHSYSDSRAFRTYYTLYADGNLEYEVDMLGANEKYCFKFDAKIASMLIDEVDYEIEDAKRVEAEVLSSFAPDNFFKIINNGCRISYSREEPGLYYYNILNNWQEQRARDLIKSLEYTEIDTQTGKKAMSRGALMFLTDNDTNPMYLSNVKTVDQTYLNFNRDGTCAMLYINCYDTYGRWFAIPKYYSLNSVVAKDAVDEILNMFDNEYNQKYK